MNTLSVKKNIYSLENPVWLHNAGMSKGIGHDRQHLSIILPANSDLQIRQINESFDVKLKLRLLNSDSKTEKTVSVLHEWVTVNTTVASVPFIDTPYINNGSDKQQTLIIEYRYPENSKILPIYRKFDNESEFLNFCKQQDSEFCLIDTEYFLMLVPQHDQETLIDIKNTIGMNRLINHYEKVISFYNELSGISFNPKQVTNKNIPNRYFIKADQHGSGAAYYSSLWTAENNSSITKFWLQDLENKWGHLHAIAHGYQGKFMSNTGLDVNEIWNNIYAASYQDIYLGDKVFECGWLYSNANELFSFINNYLENNISVNNWNLKSKLYFMMLMKDRAGNASFINFNQKFRKLCNNKNVDLYDINLLDMLANNYSKNGKIDVIPFIQMVGGKLSIHQCMINHIYHESSVYPLGMLINQDKLSSMQYKLKLKTPFDLVNATQLRSTGLTGNLQFEIEIDSFKEIYGEEMFLMEGQNHFLKTKITQPEFILSDIPIGSYTLKLPTGKSTKYNIDKMYAIVKEGDNQLGINYFKKTSSRLLDKKIIFLGFGNKNFATLIIDFVEKSIILNVTDNNPHSYFDDNKYFGIIIKSSNGIQLFSKELKGNNLDNKIGQDKIKFNYEDKIELFHAESKRIITDYGNFLTNKKDHYLTIKSNGLYNQETQNDIEEELIKHIEDGANFIKKNQQFIDEKYVEFKDDLYLAIQKTSEKNKVLLLEKYQGFISKFNDIDKYIGDVFTLNLLGIANHEIIKITIDRNQKAIAFAIDRAAMPHYYFKKISYAFVRYYDAMGIERYQYDFIGDKTTTPEEKIFPLTQQGGEKLFIHHKEANVRFKFYNLMQDKLIQPNLNNTKQIQVTYQFKTNGLQELSNDSPENIQLPKDMIVSSLTHALSMSISASEIRCPIENISTEFSEVNDSLPSINNILINN